MSMHQQPDAIAPQPAAGNFDWGDIMYPRNGLAQFGYRQELRGALRLRDLLARRPILMASVAPMAIFASVLSASAGIVALAYAVGMGTPIVTPFSYVQISCVYLLVSMLVAHSAKAPCPERTGSEMSFRPLLLPIRAWQRAEFHTRGMPGMCSLWIG